jgi:hypothetical protein
MAFEPKLNSCGLFRNDRNDKSDFTGRIDIVCPKCHASSSWWVNGWRKVSQGGLKYLYLALKPKSETAAHPAERLTGGSGNG